MKRNDIITTLYQIGAIQFGQFTLKSGQTSSLYINLRKIISYPDLLRSIANAIWEVVDPAKIEVVCGVPYTALPIATCISLDNHLPMIMRRKEKKEYGTKQLIEGEFKAGDRCLVIEDIITTGSSILETTGDLEQAGLHIQQVVALIDREQGGKATLEAAYPTQTILPLTLILDTLLSSSLLNQSEQTAIETFLSERTST